MKFEYYYSSIFRQTPSDIELPDSFAYARFNADGDSITESVYWPPIDDAVLSEADNFGGGGEQIELPEEVAMLAGTSKCPQGSGVHVAVTRHSSPTEDVVHRIAVMCVPNVVRVARARRSSWGPRCVSIPTIVANARSGLSAQETTRPRARYRGTRKNLFDVRRHAAVLNLETIQRVEEHAAA